VFAIFPNITELNQVYEEFIDSKTGKRTCLADQIESFINDRLPENSSVELEKCYWPSFHVAKKRAMYFQHLHFFDKIERRRKFDGVGTLESKGLETQRRDSCTVAQKTIYGFGKRLLGIAKSGDVERAKREAAAFAKKKITVINEKGVQFHEMIQSRKLTSSNYANENMPHLNVKRKQEARGKPPYQLGSRIPFIIVTGRKNIKRYQAAEDPDYALEHGLQPDLKYIIDTKIYKPIERFCKWFNDPELDEPGEGEGHQMLKMIFGTSFKVHKSNLLSDDPIASFVKPLLDCMVCGDRTFDKICGACRNTANYWEIQQERKRKRFYLEETYNNRLIECRACMQITPEEEVICANTSCKKYFPRRGAEYALKNFDIETQELRDIEDSVVSMPMDI